MTITYEVGNSLYVNVTNKCSNRCTFCVRNSKDMYNGKDNMWLEKEPTKEEILASLEKVDFSKYSNLVFCGYGEPSYRLVDICEVAKEAKNHIKIPIRLNTNGHANLIYGKDVTYLMEGAIDIVSISLNECSKEKYNEVCLPKFDNAFEGMLDFAKKAKAYVPRVIMTVVDVLPQEEIEACRKIAQGLEVEFRVRTFIK